MYNTIKLAGHHWCYQLCRFNNELDLNAKPDVHVIMTSIYGVRTSGNQAEMAVRETAKLFKDDYPRVNEIVQKRLYMDDSFDGNRTYDETVKLTDDLQTVLSKGGFTLKGVTYSGHDPPEHLCNEDKVSVNVAGHKWFSKTDKYSLNIGDQHFGKKVRGKISVQSVIPEKFSRRDCAGRVGEVFDLIGRIAPITVQFKLDLHEFWKRIR